MSEVSSLLRVSGQGGISLGPQPSFRLPEELGLEEGGDSIDPEPDLAPHPLCKQPESQL